MYRVLCLIACVAFCTATAVLPVVVPSAHILPAPILGAYGHGHAGIGFGHGYGHGYVGKHLGHHILKRSPHLVPVDGVGHLGAHGGHGANIAPLAAVAPVAAIAPVAYSHQARVDIHSSPVVAPVVPLVKAYGPILAPFHAKPHLAVGHYGLGHVGHY